MGAGSCAAFASVFGKLAVNTNIVLQPVLYLLSFVLDLGVHVTNDTLVIISQALRPLFIGLIVLSNILMWNMFTKAMDSCGSVSATVINTAANFFFTAIFGRVFFAEPLSLMWGLGATCIMIGLAIMHKGTSDKKIKEKKDK
eukprot:Phypoly_transcript_24271.p1 GENE.Phypoly_transcript_24271~~Phypoly_transcript_24271.p1  ORF type:complete len:167 (-),score=13.51 Phypoly_transcript_24271:54-479(-)